MMNKKIIIVTDGRRVTRVYATDVGCDVELFDEDHFTFDEQELYDATKDLPQVY